MEKEIIIYKNKKYRLVKSYEKIKQGAIHCYNNSGFGQIINPETIGDIPSNFSYQRIFYNPID